MCHVTNKWKGQIKTRREGHTQYNNKCRRRDALNEIEMGYVQIEERRPKWSWSELATFVVNNHHKQATVDIALSKILKDC
jgi:hypothetical protein